MIGDSSYSKHSTFNFSWSFFVKTRIKIVKKGVDKGLSKRGLFL